MSDFRFKQFTVSNDRSAMKVNTDGVLLGAAVTVPVPVRSTNAVPSPTRSANAVPSPTLSTIVVPSSTDSPDSAQSPKRFNILDIGTGTGTIALMLAQRTEDARIYAIDIDQASVDEASANFARSPWAERLTVELVSLQSYIQACNFDLIVSNPPYFDDSLRNPDERKADARHTASLSYREILEFASRKLTDSGRVAMVLPSEVEKDLLRCARSYSLCPSRILRIRTTERKQPRRIIVEFIRQRVDCLEDTLAIMQEGRYTDQYTALLGDFLITL